MLPTSSQSGIRLNTFQSTRLQAAINSNQLSGGMSGLEVILFPNTASEKIAEICLDVQNNQSDDSGFEFANPGMGTFQILNLPSIQVNNSGELRIGEDIALGETRVAPCP